MLMSIDFKAFLHVQFPGCRVVLCFPGLQSMRELGESTLVVNHLKIPYKNGYFLNNFGRGCRWICREWFAAAVLD